VLEKIRSHPDQFDVLITDQTMPNLTGEELAEKVLKIKPDMPIIMCTGHSDTVSREDAFAIGIKRYILKPIQGNELVYAVREVLDEK
jgi:DNA-binding NtrC family response regulator